MKKFNILDRDLDLHQHYLLEASAGTGKTFSIQNIVVRLLIEPHGELEPFSIQKILVVTFTRAATRDLKNRIRLNIEQVLNHLINWLHNRLLPDHLPDYLKGYIERGNEFVQQARRRLQHALYTFDQAQIFTIHSFCFRMLRQYALESDMGLYSLFGEDPLPHSEIMAIIRDFFRTEVRPDRYSPKQIDILLKGDPHQKKLLRAIQSGYEFPFYPPFKTVYERFIESIHFLKKSLALVSEKMIEDFRLQAAFYRNDKSGETKAETLQKVIHFSQLFDRDEWSMEDVDRLIGDGVVWVEALHPSLLKGKPPPVDRLHYPTLIEELKKHLYPLISEAGHFAALLTRMACDCRQLLKRYQTEEEKLSPDDVLYKMNQALDYPPFLNQVQRHYEAVVIDEFQDTDPLQWEIFQRLFLSDRHAWKGYLYLVGDPKQSIYSFRQADIYTYLAAARLLGESHCFSLDVNYRSQPRLVNALNLLFDSEHLPSFIPLPRQSTHLSYHSVQHSHGILSPFFEDERGAVHFFIADGQAFKKPKLADLESHIFFPFIAQEILRLKKTKEIHFRQFAVLVRDRHQALRLAEYFDRMTIPYQNQRGTSLADSPALVALIEVIRAVLHPQDHGAIRTALGNLLMGWTYEELKDLESMEFIVAMMQHLRDCLYEKGFASFFQDMLNTASKVGGVTILEQILGREGGIEFYHDLQQIADSVVDHQYLEWNGPEGIIPFLDRFQLWDQNDDERVKRFQDPTVDGVKILTLHFSKGLEFEIVFALGLVNRMSMTEDLIPVVTADGQQLLTPLATGSEEYRHYCEESDAEKMRQLYVALTRAKYQLYIPVALHLPSEKLRWGEASPLDLFLARFRQPALSSYEMLYERIKDHTGCHLLDFLERIGNLHAITYSIHQKVLSLPSEQMEPKGSLSLHEPSEVMIAGKRLWMTSFSSLSHHVELQPSERLDVKSFPYEEQLLEKGVHTMPANSETGLLMHCLMEKLNFSDFQEIHHSEQAISLIRPFLQKSHLKEWETVIATIVFNTLKTSLFPISEDFCLADLQPNHFYREMPFIFPYQNEKWMEEVEGGEGMIKGVIDLLFYQSGKYYLVDWKTNWLGEGVEAYQPSQLQIAMKENAYFLQAAIYTEALKRYVRLVDLRPFEECFGGVFYLFMRGLEPGRRNGMYHFFPS